MGISFHLVFTPGLPPGYGDIDGIYSSVCSPQTLMRIAYLQGVAKESWYFEAVQFLLAQKYDVPIFKILW